MKYCTALLFLVVAFMAAVPVEVEARAANKARLPTSAEIAAKQRIARNQFNPHNAPSKTRMRRSQASQGVCSAGFYNTCIPGSSLFGSSCCTLGLTCAPLVGYGVSVCVQVSQSAVQVNSILGDIGTLGLTSSSQITNYLGQKATTYQAGVVLGAQAGVGTSTTGSTTGSTGSVGTISGIGAGVEAVTGVTTGTTVYGSNGSAIGVGAEAGVVAGETYYGNGVYKAAGVDVGAGAGVQAGSVLYK